MPMVFQSPTSPDQILFALKDLVDADLTGLRISVAYATRPGCENLVSVLAERLGIGALLAASKRLITSFDFGHTDPEALRFWRGLPNSDLRVANVTRRLDGILNLVPTTSNFHPKVYFFDHPNRVAALVGSANLTRRALSVNTEVANWEATADVVVVDRIWTGSWDSADVLTDDLLEEYSAHQPDRPVPDLDSGIEGPQIQLPVTGHRLIDAIDQGLDPVEFQCMWVQAGLMSSGGSQNQLELPRGANRFFGFNYDAYEPDHLTIGAPVLISRAHQWTDRSLTWHAGGGQNAMERLNLPTLAQGGFNYVHTAILFRRTLQGFEFTVAPWGTDRANGWLNASAASETLFRTGAAANSRLCGLF